MKVKKVVLIIIWALLYIISGCTNDQPVIPKNKSLAITVNIKDMSLSFVDLEEANVIETWTLDKPYTGGVLLPDNDTLLLYGKQVETVDSYSLRTGKRINSWETGRGIVEGVLLSDREEIALSDQERQSVRFFRFDGEEIKEVVKTGNPLALIPTISQLYVVSYNSKKLTTIDLQSKEIIRQFSIHSAATGAIIQEDKNEIWIGGHGLGSELESYIHVYDVKTGELKRKISAPIMPIKLLHNNDGTFALSHGSNNLYKISDEGVIQAKITLGANPFEMVEYKGQLLVAGYDSNDIHFITEKDLSIGNSVKVGKGPFKIIIREID